VQVAEVRSGAKASVVSWQNLVKGGSSAPLQHSEEQNHLRSLADQATSS